MTTEKRKLAIILGIRPDLIRASLVLRRLQTEARDDVVFIWSGQHYSDNLKDVFLRELDIQPPDIELGAVGETDAEVVGRRRLEALPGAGRAPAGCGRVPRRHEHGHGQHRGGPH